MANLKRNTDLRARVAVRALSPGRLVRMEPRDLATLEQRQHDAQLQEDSTKRITLAGAGNVGTITTDYVCGRCGSRTCDYVDSGRRDMGKCETWGNKDGQGTSRCVHCISCGNKWEVDDV